MGSIKRIALRMQTRRLMIVQSTRRKLPAMAARISNARGMVLVETSIVSLIPSWMAWSISVWLLTLVFIVDGDCCARVWAKLAMSAASFEPASTTLPLQEEVLAAMSEVLPPSARS